MYKTIEINEDLTLGIEYELNEGQRGTNDLPEIKPEIVTYTIDSIAKGDLMDFFYAIEGNSDFETELQEKLIN